VDFSAICRDVVKVVHQNQRLILVHGGSAEANGRQR
jgi:acetylglutamate kinase